MSKRMKDLKECRECGDIFFSEYKKQMFCSEECKYEYDNSGWKRSNYEEKDISDWDVDDHLAAWYDDMMEK